MEHDTHHTAEENSTLIGLVGAVLGLIIAGVAIAVGYFLAG